MNTSTLLPRLKTSFAKCTPLPPEQPAIIRCERLYNDQPRGVYFFRATSSLPDQAELAHIHQDVVGPSYFQSEGPARWSHYLVFVTNDENRKNAAFRERQRAIEDDKNYARKFVVYESELDGFIDHSITQPRAAAHGSSVAETWSTRLREAGLERIQSNDPRAPFIREIRDGQTAPSAEPARKLASLKGSEPASQKQIQLLQINSFGDRRLRGAFKMGRVNLIRGPNGSGKTSLLEAIEHYFCGATFRSNGERSAFDASVTFANGRNPIPYTIRQSSYYQEKDRQWYGRTVNRGNRLFEGFSRFNFLNTDAAVHFSSDGDLRDLREILSKIALGPDAAHTWNRIGEFANDIAVQLTPLQTTRENLARNIGDATARLSALRTASPQAEAQWRHAQAALAALNWPPTEMPLPSAEATWFVQFQPLRAFVEGSPSIGETQSISDLHQLHSELKRDVGRLTQIQTQSKTAARRAVELQRQRTATERRRATLSRLKQYIDAGFPSLLNTRARLNEKLTDLARTAIPEPERADLLRTSADLSCSDKTVTAFDAALQTHLSAKRLELQAAERERADLERRLTQTDAVLADVRRLGRQYATLQPTATECPLCQSEMDMAELLKRIEVASDRAGQASFLESSNTRTVQLRQDIQHLTSVALTVASLLNPRIALMGETVAEVGEQLLQAQQSIETCKAELTKLDSQLSMLRSTRLSEDEYSSLVSNMRAEPQRSLIADSPDAATIDAMLTEQTANEESLSVEEGEALATATSIADELVALEQKYQNPHADDLLAWVNTRAGTLLELIKAFETLPTSLQRTFPENLQSLLNLGRPALRALDDLNFQLQAERSLNKEAKTLEEQMTREREELSRANQQHSRLESALNVLRDLQTNHSLESGLSTFLRENLDSIQKIFARIHVPHELKLTNLVDCKLTRMGSPNEVDLTQISTGQRAALMLSIFLTLNLSLRGGPPFMLIDDPIAHIDDLNALSFLDFLADIAETKQRQIFFATANEKLANLFERKMEFLGDDFRTHAIAGVG